MTYGNRCQLCGELYTGFMHTCLTPGVLNQPVYKPALPQIPVGWKCPQCQNIHAPAVLACPNCNRALGLINENSGTARALAEYLEKQI